jgi:hypothetical protein
VRPLCALEARACIKRCCQCLPVDTPPPPPPPPPPPRPPPPPHPTPPHPTPPHPQGAIFLGGSVSDTISGGVANPEAFAAMPDCFAYGMLCAVAAAAFWLLFATYYELPVSTTHSIVGGVMGFALVYGARGGTAAAGRRRARRDARGDGGKCRVPAPPQIPLPLPLRKPACTYARAPEASAFGDRPRASLHPDRPPWP